MIPGTVAPPLNTTRQEFGPSLRAHRERRGISVQAIADSTKINASLLASLERNDVSQWPKGIYRRAFLREYAAAIGLEPAAVLAEFLQLFPEDGGAGGVRDDDGTPGSNGALRLTLAADTAARWRAAVVRMASAGLDACAVLLAGFVASTIGGVDPWTISGVIALVYYPITGACLGHGLAAWWFNPSRVSHLRRRPSASRAMADRWRRIASWPLTVMSLNVSRDGRDEEEGTAAQELSAASH